MDETHGFWRRIGDRVAVRPRAVWITGSIVLALLAANLLNLDTGLTSGNSFRGEVDSVQGQQILARNFPAGASAPTDVIVPDRGRAQAVAERADRAQGPREPGEQAGRRARRARG